MVQFFHSPLFFVQYCDLWGSTGSSAFTKNIMLKIKSLVLGLTDLSIQFSREKLCFLASFPYFVQTQCFFYLNFLFVQYTVLTNHEYQFSLCI